MFPSFSRLLPALMLPLTGVFTTAAGQSLPPAHTTVVKQVYQNERGRPVPQAQAHQYAVICRPQPEGSRTHTRGETTLYTVETFSTDGTRLSRATYQALHEPVDWEHFGDPAFSQALRQGLCYEYHPGGQVKFEGRFVQGQGQGLHRRYYPSGKRLSETGMEKDGAEGWVKAYYENGQLQLHYPLVQGQPQGEWWEYDPSGKPKLKRILDKGQPVSTVHYDAQGQPLPSTGNDSASDSSSH
jgi:hypothetical protein